MLLPNHIQPYWFVSSAARGPQPALLPAPSSFSSSITSPHLSIPPVSSSHQPFAPLTDVHCCDFSHPRLSAMPSCLSASPSVLAPWLDGVQHMGFPRTPNTTSDPPDSPAVLEPTYVADPEFTEAACPGLCNPRIPRAPRVAPSTSSCQATVFSDAFPSDKTCTRAEATNYMRLHGILPSCRRTTATNDSLHDPHVQGDVFHTSRTHPFLVLIPHHRSRPLRAQKMTHRDARSRSTCSAYPRSSFIGTFTVHRTSFGGRCG